MRALSEALARLESSVAAVSPDIVAGLPAGADEDEIAALRASLAPWVLPADAEELLRTWNGARMFGRWELYPTDVIASTYRQQVENGWAPPALIQLFTDGSGCAMFVETAETAEAATGTVWGLPHSEDYSLRFASLADMVDAVSDALSAGLLVPELRGERWFFDEPDLDVVADTGLGGSSPRESETVDAFPHPAWPGVWLRSIGIEVEAQTARGATRTVAEIAAAAESGSVSGTIAGDVAFRGGGSGFDEIVVTDATGGIPVMVPLRRGQFSVTSAASAELDVSFIDGRVVADAFRVLTWFPMGD